MAADHVIRDDLAFTKAINDANSLAESGKLVTFGIVLHEPHTGYGYIQMGLQNGSGFVVKKFVEKPFSDVARDYIESGNYFWNSGMFLFKASRYLEELKRFRPDIYKYSFSLNSKLNEH